MNYPLANRLFLSVVVSGVSILSANNFASAQSANPCAQYIPNLQNGDYGTYYRCASEAIKRQQLQPNSQPYYNSPNSSLGVFKTINDGYWNHGYGRLQENMWNGGIPRSTKPPTYYGN
jgi:hypothetical protein